MNSQLSLAAFRLGCRIAEFVTWFDELIRDRIHPNDDELDVPLEYGRRLEDTRLQKLEVQIAESLQVLRALGDTDLSKNAFDQARRFVGDAMRAALGFTQEDKLDSPPIAAIRDRLVWLEDYRYEADEKTWFQADRTVSEKIRSEISEFTSFFADLATFFPEDLACFYRLGRRFFELQDSHTEMQGFHEKSQPEQYRLVSDQLYPELLPLMTACAQQEPNFPWNLGPQIEYARFPSFLRDQPQAIEEYLKRQAEQQQANAALGGKGGEHTGTQTVIPQTNDRTIPDGSTAPVRTNGNGSVPLETLEQGNEVPHPQSATEGVDDENTPPQHPLSLASEYKIGRLVIKPNAETSSFQWNLDSESATNTVEIPDTYWALFAALLKTIGKPQSPKALESKLGMSYTQVTSYKDRINNILSEKCPSLTITAYKYQLKFVDHKSATGGIR